MARKKNGETKLIMPKHLAEVPYFRLALKVYAAHPHGVGFDVFKDELYTELHSEGVESAKSSDGSHYTKCAQLPRYFGMVRYVSSSEAKGDAALTLRGQRMYAAMTATPVDSSTIHELIFEAIRFNQFGRRNEGVGSESYCEPLAIFFKAARDLDGVTNKEFGYILQELDQGLKGYRTVIAEILQQRAAGGTIPVVAGTQADNLSDWKAILFLKNVGFLEKDVSGKVKLTGALVEKYGMELSSLPLYSNGFKRQIFSNWLRSKGKDEQTVDNYRRSLEGMSQRIGSKTSGTFEGFYEALVGREPIKMVFDVTSLADYDRVFAALNLFWDMPQTTSPGPFDEDRYAECYYYAKAPQNVDNARLKNACERYREFLGWWDAHKSEFQVNEMEANMFNGKMGAIQKITYGAPGTGKSFEIAEKVPDEDVFRTTFHPDSDYSTFVGAYKPTMTGAEIAYAFRPQAFMRAYVRAWQLMKSPSADGTVNPVVLVIEEINRGNCAQVFGDLFQLLDRDDATGFSTYPIDADTDLAKWLAEVRVKKPDGLDGDLIFGAALADVKRPSCIKEDDWDKIVKGEKLALPSNLYIWATMNTSDQSLFPIDSAFKRRWDWKYVPIAKPDKDGDATWKERKIKVGESLYDWWDFLSIINRHIAKATESEDKQLGYFFVKAPDDTGYITAERFANKVLFYLYGDVFKSYDLPTAVFKNDAGKTWSFKDFFYDKKTEVDAAGGVKVTKNAGDVNETVLTAFLDHLKWKDDEGEKTVNKTAIGA